MHQGRALPRADLFRRSGAASAATRRQKGRRQVSTHQLGYGARHYRQALYRDCGLARRPAGDRPLQLCGHHGATAIWLDGSTLFLQAGRIAARSHDLLGRRQGRLCRDRRRRNRHRYGGVRERATDTHLGLEPDRIQSASMEPDPGSKAARRQADRDRSLPQSDRGKVSPSSRVNARD